MGGQARAYWNCSALERQHSTGILALRTASISAELVAKTFRIRQYRGNSIRCVFDASSTQVVAFPQQQWNPCRERSKQKKGTRKTGKKRGNPYHLKRSCEIHPAEAVRSAPIILVRKSETSCGQTDIPASPSSPGGKITGPQTRTNGAVNPPRRHFRSATARKKVSVRSERSRNHVAEAPPSGILGSHAIRVFVSPGSQTR